MVFWKQSEWGGNVGRLRESPFDLGINDKKRTPFFLVFLEMYLFRPATDGFRGTRP